MTLMKCAKSIRIASYVFKCIRLLSQSTNEMKKSVFISQTHNVYANLALEDWLYRNYNFTDHHVLMLWSNDPCIIIGRHQNPWKEANISGLKKITERGVQLARRNSGGGTVYQDRGNLNLTFFVPRSCYSRKENLEIIVRAIFKHFSIKIDISPKEELYIQKYKISGSAARFGCLNTYHHCTLLVDVDKICLAMALQNEQFEIETTATKSTVSKVANLSDFYPGITIDELMAAISLEFVENHPKNKCFFRKVEPIDEIFPGISQIREVFEDWEWCYGKTPKFKLIKKFSVPSHLLHNSSSDTNAKLGVVMVVEHGRILDVMLDVPPSLSEAGFSDEINIVSKLKGQKYCFQWERDRDLHGLNDSKAHFIANCVWQILPNHY